MKSLTLEALVHFLIERMENNFSKILGESRAGIFRAL